MLVSFVGRPRLCGGRPWLSSARSRGSVARHEVRPLPARESARREVLRRVCGAAGGGGRLRALRDAPAAGSEILPGVRVARGRRRPRRRDALRLAGRVHAHAHRGEDPRLARCTRGRAQARHRALRGPQGLDGAPGRPRRRGRPPAARRRARAHDRGRPPLRGHREPGHGRRHHGPLRRADRPRGSRRPRVLRRPPDAAAGEGARGGAASQPRAAGPHPRGPQLRRGGRALHRQRSAHGLHGDRPDDTPGRPHGADGHAGHDPDSVGDAGPDRGLRPHAAAGTAAGEGPRRAARGLRAHRRLADPLAAARGRRARAHALRRPRSRAAAAGAGARRQRILDAIKRFVLRESRVQPVALLFEDLHWIDSETQALLARLVESLPTARVLLLVNYRPEYQHGWGGKTYYTQLRIDPLAAESAAALLDALLGAGRPLEPLKRLLLDRTEGNPFFLEESVRTLVETGVVAGERGSFRLAKGLDTIQVPATVQAVLAARVDRLPPSIKHLLQSAAVIGKTVALTLLETVAETTALELRRGLAQLQAAEFLYETSLFPELEYTFKHALTLEVAYQSLLRERRRLLHTGVLAALEARERGHAPESVEVLAHHAVRGEVWTSAASYLYRAGAKAQAEARYGTAVTFYEASVDALQRLGDAADRNLELDAYLELWSTRISTGQVDGLGVLGDKVEALARSLDDGPRLARVQGRQAQAIALAGAVPGTLART